MLRQPAFHLDDLLHLVEEPGVDLRRLGDRLDGDFLAQRVADLKNPFGRGHGQLLQPLLTFHWLV